MLRDWDVKLDALFRQEAGIKPCLISPWCWSKIICLISPRCWSKTACLISKLCLSKLMSYFTMMLVLDHMSSPLIPANFFLLRVLGPKRSSAILNLLSAPSCDIWITCYCPSFPMPLYITSRSLSARMRVAPYRSLSPSDEVVTSFSFVHEALG